MVALRQEAQPIDAPEWVAERLAMIKPTDLGQGGPVIAALRHIEETGGPAALAAVRAELGPPQDFVESFRYSPRFLLSICGAWATWAVTQRHSSYAQEAYTLGQAWGRRIGETPLGKTMLQATGGEAARLLSSVGAATRANNNFTEIQFERSGPEGVLQVRHQLYGAAWMLGMLEAAGPALTGHPLRITALRVLGSAGADFEMVFDLSPP